MSSILVAVDHSENQRLLLEWLGKFHQVIAHTDENFEMAFDLGVFDGRALDRLWRQIHLRKNAVQPLYLPILLITTRQDISLITRRLWQVIDEIIITPIEKPELYVRVEVLLRARRLSLELEGKNIELRQEILDHREAAQALQESEDRFGVALKNSPIIVAHIDPQLRYIWIHNAQYAFGDKEVVGKRDDELLPGDKTADLMNLKQDVLDSGIGQRSEIELDIGDQTKTFDVTIEPILDINAKIVGATMAAQDITERKSAEETLRQMAALEERQRLARDLHDSVNQTIFTMSVLAEAVPHLIDHNPEQANKRLHELGLLARAAMSEMRTLLLELRPANIINTSMSELLAHLVNAVQARQRIDLSASVDYDQPLPEDVHIALYRIVQESLNNILKHSGATEAQISLKAEKGCVLLQVMDNGNGFDTEGMAAGLGMSVMRERAATIGATLEVISRSGQGTHILVSWPLPAN